MRRVVAAGTRPFSRGQLVALTRAAFPLAAHIDVTVEPDGDVRVWADLTDSDVAADAAVPAWRDAIASAVPGSPTVEEIDAATQAQRDANAQTLRTRAGAALATNTAYAAIAAPTAAQVRDQVSVLTQECSAVIRLLLGQLDAT